MFIPLGCEVLWRKVNLVSMLRRTIVVMKPAQITDTSISLTLCPGDEKCLPTGRIVFAPTDRMCSRNLSPRRLPVSPMYDVNQTTGSASELVPESLLIARGVESPRRVGMGPGYPRGRPQGKVPDSTSVGPVDWRPLFTKMSRRLLSQQYAYKMRKGSKIALVSGSGLRRAKFLVMIFLTCVFWGW